MHVLVEFRPEAVDAKVNEGGEAEVLDVAEVVGYLLPVDADLVEVVHFERLVLNQFLDHVGELPGGPALLEVGLVELGHCGLVFAVDGLEVLLLGLVQLDEGLLRHAEARGFHTFVSVGHQDVRISGFVQIRMVGQVVSQVCDVVHHQLLHLGFEHLFNTQLLLQIFIICLKLALVVHTVGQDTV